MSRSNDCSRPRSSCNDEFLLILILVIFLLFLVD